MQVAFAPEHLRCPVCRRDRTLRVHSERADEREVRDGALQCVACGQEQPLQRGVAHLLLAPPAHLRREAAGLERFAEHIRSHGWDREMVRKLPYLEDGYWYVQATSINQLLATVSFAPGQSLLDVGSNTCWATNYFAARGLKAIALDISTVELQGLYTADYFIDDGSSYFERVLGSMNDMPLASKSLDYVYCCEVLHHNDSAGLRRTFEEAYRVLKPGGKLLVVNETLKTARDPVGVHAEAVAEFDGYEHAHWAWQYRWEATRAGFSTRLIEPGYHRFFRESPGVKPPALPWRPRVLYELRSHALGRRLYLAWIMHIAGDVAFGMVATKPARRRSLQAAPLALGRLARLASRTGWRARPLAP